MAVDYTIPESVYNWKTNHLDAALNITIDNIEKRIKAFEFVIVDPAAAGAANTYEYPYDQAGLTREFLDEIYAIFLTQISRNGVFPTGTMPTSLQNFDGMTDAQKETALGTSGLWPIYQYYKDLIGRVFAEGAKLKDGPVDSYTNTLAKVVDVSVIPPVVHGGVTYSYVGVYQGNTYLFKSNAAAGTDPLDSVIKDANGVLTFSRAQTTMTALRVDSVTLLPAAGTFSTSIGVRLLSAPEYLYYWNEARITILRAQLAYKEAITVELQEDLRQANAALAELERIAGSVRAQSEKGEPNPVSVSESFLLDLYEAQVSTPGKQMFNTNAGDDIHNYSEWQENRTNLKNYIDRKSAQSQQAMLDYQTVLNRYNNAYEVMAKLQEKIQGLLSSQLRNI